MGLFAAAASLVTPVTHHVLADVHRRPPMVDLTNGGKMSGACIVGLDESKNVQVYAQSPGFPAVTKAQVESFLGNMDNPNVFGATGITIGDKKFVAVGPNPGIALRGKKGQG